MPGEEKKMKSSHLIDILQKYQDSSGEDKEVYMMSGYSMLPIEHIFALTKGGKKFIAVSNHDVRIEFEELHSL